MGTPPRGDTAPGDTARTPQPRPAAHSDPHSIITSSPRGSRSRAGANPSLLGLGKATKRSRGAGRRDGDSLQASDGTRREDLSKRCEESPGARREHCDERCAQEEERLQTCFCFLPYVQLPTHLQQRAAACWLPRGTQSPSTSLLSLRSSAFAHCVTSSLKPKKQETGLF